MIKGIEKSLVIWSFWMPFKRILEPISHFWSLWIIQSEFTCGRGGHSTRGKVSPPPPLPSCMLSFLCYAKGNEKTLVIWSVWKPFKRILETISHYLVSVNIVNICLWLGGGDNLSRGKSVPPPQPSCMLSFLCNDKRDWEEPGHLKFLNALQEDTGNSFSYLVPMNTVRIYLSQV